MEAECGAANRKTISSILEKADQAYVRDFE